MLSVRRGAAPVRVAARPHTTCLPLTPDAAVIGRQLRCCGAVQRRQQRRPHGRRWGPQVRLPPASLWPNLSTHDQHPRQRSAPPRCVASSGGPRVTPAAPPCPGTVINLPALFEELAPLDDAGIEWRGRLLLSDRAHLLFDHHKVRPSPCAGKGCRPLIRLAHWRTGRGWGAGGAEGQRGDWHHQERCAPASLAPTFPRPH